MAPLQHWALMQRLRDEILGRCLGATSGARELTPDGHYGRAAVNAGRIFFAG